MTPTPTRDTEAGRIYNDLRNLARKHHRDASEYLTLYALEGLLARLAASDQSNDFVLKGGVLMATLAERRPTRDIDLRAAGFANDLTGGERRIRAIAALDLNDGLTFNVATVSAELIRDDAEYAGIRVHLVATLATAKISIHIDLSFGDPIWPGPVATDVPRLLGGLVRLNGYPDHMVLAEKIVTAIQRGAANTRWRDFVDIAAIASRRSIAADDLTTALDVVAKHRQAELQPLSQALDGLADIAQPKWLAWRRKQRLEHVTPQQLQYLVDRCAAFADPVLNGTATGRTWRPEEWVWAPTPSQ